jgi:hypothetical protein
MEKINDKSTTLKISSCSNFHMVQSVKYCRIRTMGKVYREKWQQGRRAQNQSNQINYKKQNDILWCGIIKNVTFW